ncbi:type II toxin-antitoxin system ParD family antitoxin [Beijerinckia sp. L45]|uniref:type II toxin-antitoxin system ParD family antitoxin n=1 Tax=Beijerinckia sp. L45 TaxID=1641855 RepID=UPI00131D3774|nr:type II toxin-antitoxin system ParD family antitoxin [Beijerinckia sp. L45]
MAKTVAVTDAVEETIERLVKTGHYSSNSDVVREGVRLLDERDKSLALLDEAIAVGIADAEAGRVIPADEVFAELRARYSAMIKPGQAGE